MNVKNLADYKKFKQMTDFRIFFHLFFFCIYPLGTIKKIPVACPLKEQETKNKSGVMEDSDQLLEIKTCSLPDHQKYRAGVHEW